jgi:hypothetical protein
MGADTGGRAAGGTLPGSRQFIDVNGFISFFAKFKGSGSADNSGTDDDYIRGDVHAEPPRLKWRLKISCHEMDKNYNDNYLGLHKY